MLGLGDKHIPARTKGAVLGVQTKGAQIFPGQKEGQVKWAPGEAMAWVACVAVLARPVLSLASDSTSEPLLLMCKSLQHKTCFTGRGVPGPLSTPCPAPCLVRGLRTMRGCALSLGPRDG